MPEHTQADLDQLIREKLTECSSFPNVCTLKSTEAGFERIVKRAKEIIINDGLTDLDTILARIDNEIGWS